MTDGLYNVKISSQPTKSKTSSGPIKVPQARFKDPHARYKLEMIKSIRASRAASDPKISEAILRAKKISLVCMVCLRITTGRGKEKWREKLNCPGPKRLTTQMMKRMAVLHNRVNTSTSVTRR
ncbi:hypothetical protein HanHA300_Chr00c0045g0696991 [Helianthus annuus]|nr:hypothetical protein HanHA300_Chr00c0045g0696991 [Helianthus annuus]